jgi:hypothetical protein
MSSSFNRLPKTALLIGLLLVSLTLISCALISTTSQKINNIATQAGSLLDTAQPAIEEMATNVGTVEAQAGTLLDTAQPSIDEMATAVSTAASGPAGSSAATDVADAQGTIAALMGDTPEPAAMTLQSALPRSFQYGALVFTLQSAAITTQAPAGADPADQKGAYAQTVWKVSNATADNQRVNSGVMTLSLAGGKYTRPVDVTVGPQSNQDLSVVFSVPAGSTWDGASLSLAEPGKVPAQLALEGTAPALEEPVKVAVSGEAQVTSPNLLHYQIVDGATALNGPGFRADTGTHVLILKVTATCKDRYDCYVGPNSFRLFVDGVSSDLQKLDPVSAAIKAGGASQDFTLAFQLPDSAKTVALEVGETGKDTKQIPLNLPKP